MKQISKIGVWKAQKTLRKTKAASPMQGIDLLQTQRKMRLKSRPYEKMARVKQLYFERRNIRLKIELKISESGGEIETHSI